MPPLRTLRSISEATIPGFATETNFRLVGCLIAPCFLGGRREGAARGKPGRRREPRHGLLLGAGALFSLLLAPALWPSRPNSDDERSTGGTSANRGLPLQWASPLTLSHSLSLSLRKILLLVCFLLGAKMKFLSVSKGKSV